jgi:hypothetical protein
MLQTISQLAKNIVAQMPAEAAEVVHSAFLHEVWLTTPTGELEIGGRANDWLSDHDMHLNRDYIFSWKVVQGSRDHYRFAFILISQAERFKKEFLPYLVPMVN